MYYRKTIDGQTIADKCGIGDIYAACGERIHHGDITQVAYVLDMTATGMDMLFELEHGDETPQELNFDDA